MRRGLTIFHIVLQLMILLPLLGRCEDYGCVPLSLARVLTTQEMLPQNRAGRLSRGAVSTQPDIWPSDSYRTRSTKPKEVAPGSCFISSKYERSQDSNSKTAKHMGVTHCHWFSIGVSAWERCLHLPPVPFTELRGMHTQCKSGVPAGFAAHGRWSL